MKHSVGFSVAAGATEQLIVNIPPGYLAIVTLVYVTNTHGSGSGSYTLQWQHAHDPTHKIRIAYGKSLSHGNSDQYSDGELVMQSEDNLLFSCDVAMDIVVTLDFLLAPIVNAFEQDDPEE
jgi:hypothetical protein